MGDGETATRMPADPALRGQGRSLAGLIDVLDRADGAAAGRRPQLRRTSAHRSAGARTGAVRTVPLRSVQPAPPARPTPSPRAHVLPEPERAPVRGLSGLLRRAALWGSGPRGEHLAWRVARPAAAPVAAPAARRSARVRSVVRRLSLWGSGPGGKYLAWGGPALPDPRPDADAPVVLRELPSTPTIQPAAPSPAVALLPRGPASSAGLRGVPPVPRGEVAVPGVDRADRLNAPGPPAGRRGPGGRRRRPDRRGRGGTRCPTRSGARPRRRDGPGPRAPHGARSPEYLALAPDHTCCSRDHGSQPLDAVLRTAPSTPRPVALFPG
jgi:hypothetical protein